MVACNILQCNPPYNNTHMSDEMKCPTCGCKCSAAAVGAEQQAPVVETPDAPQMKSFRLHRQSIQDTEFAVLLALVPAMTMTLFNLMGLL